MMQIKTVVCTECGKPCRTDAEKDMHTRFTGHATYVDQVRGKGQPCNLRGLGQGEGAAMQPTWTTYQSDDRRP